MKTIISNIFKDTYRGNKKRECRYKKQHANTF